MVYQMDRRVVKTRQILQDALLSLLREMPIEQVEIQAITERANTARVTFYRHYGTKEELLLDALENFYEEMKAEIPPISFKGVLDLEQPPPILPLFRFLERDRELNKKLFTGSASALIQQRVRHYIVEQVVLVFSKTPGFADHPVGLIGNHLASNIIGYVMWWLAEDLPYSAEYMARLTHQMAWLGAQSLIEGNERLTVAIYDPGRHAG